MKALVQRVRVAKVWINNHIYNEISAGMVVFLGVKRDDNEKDAAQLAGKTTRLRIFPDEKDRMNRNVCDIDGEILVISQFTLYANTRKGNRPSFINAAPPAQAEILYNQYVQCLKNDLPTEAIKTGRFRASMQIEMINDGPVTISLDSDQPLCAESSDLSHKLD